jgi:hypothetical protein
MYVASIIHSNFVQYRDNIFLSFVVEILTGKTGISSTPEPGEIASVKRSSGCRYRFEQGRTSSYLRSKLISLYNSRRVL